MRRRPDGAIGGANGDPQRVPDRTTHGFVEAHQAGKNRESGRVGRRPSLWTPGVGGEVEDGTGVGFPSLRSPIPSRGEQLEQPPAIAIDDEQVAIAARPAAWHSALDEARLRRRDRRNRISGLAAEAAVAFAAVGDEGHRDARLAAADADIRDPVRWRSEVRMRRARAPDEVEVRARLWIDWGVRDVEIPPVVAGEEPPAAKVVDGTEIVRRLKEATVYIKIKVAGKNLGSGTGFVIEVQGNSMFMAGFLYAAGGAATWVASNGPMTSPTQYAGSLVTYHGGQTLTGNYLPATLVAPPLGTISMAAMDLFASRDEGAVTNAGLASNWGTATNSRPSGPINEVSFPYAFPRSGDYRMWVQVRTEGRVWTGVFDVLVRPASGVVAKGG